MKMMSEHWLDIEVTCSNKAHVFVCFDETVVQDLIKPGRLVMCGEANDNLIFGIF